MQRGGRFFSRPSDRAMGAEDSNFLIDPKYRRALYTMSCLNSFRAAFLRAHVDRIHSGRANESLIQEYEALMAKLCASTRPATREDIIACITNLFLEYVGIYPLWSSVSRDLASITTLKGDARLGACLRLLRVFYAIDAWSPFLSLWRFFAPSADGAPAISDQNIGEMIIRGDYNVLLYVCDDSETANIALIAELMSFARKQGRHVEEVCDMIRYTSSTAQVMPNLVRFVILTLLNMFDPRPRPPLQPRGRRMESTIQQTKSLTVPEMCPWNDPEIELDVLRMTCYVASQSSVQLRAIAPSRVVAPLEDSARRCIGDISLSEETMLATELAKSPLFAEDQIPVALQPIKILAQLRADTFVGFDGTRRIIINGPMDDARARTCVNIARLARELGIPRENANPRCIAIQGAWTVAPKAPAVAERPLTLFFVFDASIEALPEKMPRPAEVVKTLRAVPVLLRKYVANCMWRFVMNFPGRSASADILVADRGMNIFGYNEVEIGQGARERATAHNDVLLAFANDHVFYERLAMRWAVQLRHIALVECAACSTCSACPANPVLPLRGNAPPALASRPRVELTGISHAALSQCAGRAATIGDIWLSQLKKFRS